MRVWQLAFLIAIVVLLLATVLAFGLSSLSSDQAGHKLAGAVVGIVNAGYQILVLSLQAATLIRESSSTLFY